MTTAAAAVLPETATRAVVAERPYYSVTEVAALLGVSRVSIWRWISSGRLPVTRLGHRTVRIKREDLEAIVRPVRGVTPRTRSTDAASAAFTATESDAPQHLVVFYDAEPFLLDRVTDFIRPALQAGECGMVVATPEHRARIEERLEAAGVDMHLARGDGRYLAVDAVGMLSRFMVDDAPDASRFKREAGGYLEAAGGRRVRIFGEMVSLLVADGNEEAALGLEALWNDLQTEHPFSLLCGYSMEQFGGAALAPVLLEACAEHSGVVPVESYSGLDDNDARLRQVAALQQKAASLEREVAERKRAQEQLQVALAAERSARDTAEAALRAREEFLSIASHELRTPITVLGAQAQLSLRRLERTGQLEPERVVQALRTVGSQARKLSRLVSQLLDVSRLDSGKLTIEPQPTDLVDLVDQAVASCRTLSTAHTLSLAAPAALDMNVDALRLEQVFINLLDNAIKYSPNGGLIEVTVALLAPTRVEVRVRDHGLGIPVDKRARIFERFYQAHETGFASGMGLGLYVSRQIVELHGGQIRAEFPAGGGTCVVVELPIA